MFPIFFFVVNIATLERLTEGSIAGFDYTAFYMVFAPHWAWAILLPFHFLMGPTHGAIVNWRGDLSADNNRIRSESENGVGLLLLAESVNAQLVGELAARAALDVEPAP